MNENNNNLSWVDDVKSYITGMPPRLRDTWEWWSAVWAFDYGDGSYLANLIKENDIPHEYRYVVAQIILGERKPNLKAKVKSKIEPIKRAEILNAYFIFADLRETLKVEPEKTFHKNTKKEPIELMRIADSLTDDFFELAFEECGIGIEAVKKIIREGKERLRKFPDL